MKKETGELLEMLKRSSDLSEYRNAVSDDMIEKISLSECLNLILEKKELKKTGYPILYPKYERGNVILYGFTHNLPLGEGNELLYEMGHLIIE